MFENQIQELFQRLNSIVIISISPFCDFSTLDCPIVIRTEGYGP